MAAACVVVTALAGLGVVSAQAADDMATYRQRVHFRKALAQAENPAGVLRRGLRHSDEAIRRFALWKLYDLEKEQAHRQIVAAASDSSPWVRRLAATLIAATFPLEERDTLTRLASEDADKDVRLAASRAYWPFYRETILLRDNPAWDHEVVSLGQAPWPATTWKLRHDPQAQGHHLGYPSAQFDDADWQEVMSARPWPFTTPTVGWYRSVAKLPGQGQAHAIEIMLDHVADSAWVWLNGQYLGQRLAQQPGSLRLDASAEVVWGGVNVLVVRVESHSGQGGLLQGVQYELFK